MVQILWLKQVVLGVKKCKIYFSSSWIKIKKSVRVWQNALEMAYRDKKSAVGEQSISSVLTASQLTPFMSSDSIEAS